jgi:hypothetical protein
VGTQRESRHGFGGSPPTFRFLLIKSGCQLTLRSSKQRRPDGKERRPQLRLDQSSPVRVKSLMSPPRLRACMRWPLYLIRAANRGPLVYLRVSIDYSGSELPGR